MTGSLVVTLPPTTTLQSYLGLYLSPGVRYLRSVKGKNYFYEGQGENKKVEIMLRFKMKLINLYLDVPRQAARCFFLPYVGVWMVRGPDPNKVMMIYSPGIFLSFPMSRHFRREGWEKVTIKWQVSYCLIGPGQCKWSVLQSNKVVPASASATHYTVIQHSFSSVTSPKQFI